jgi:hypothetical protein
MALRRVAVLFAESKYFDADKEHKAALLEQKKRKAITNLEKGGRTNKTWRTQSAPGPGPTAVVSIEPLVEPVAREEEDLDGARALEMLYNQLPDHSSSHRTLGAQKKKVIEPVMDNFINAKTRPYLRCFKSQKPVLVNKLEFVSKM